MRAIAFSFAVLLLGLLVVGSATALAGDRLVIASIDKHPNAMLRNYTPIPKKLDVSSYVCGAGSGYPSAVCSDGHICCFANRGYHFCCYAGTQCGGDGNCY